MTNNRLMVNPSMLPELIGLFKYQLGMCNLKPGELCLAVTDMAYNPLYADACIGAAIDLGAESMKITLPYNKPLPSKSWGSAFKEADLIVYSTTHTLHYTEEYRAALKSGARILMAVKPFHIMKSLRADPEVIERTKKAAEIMRKTNRIRIVSDAGTDFTAIRGKRPVVAHYGVADIPGHSDFWGAGVVETAPMEGTAEGTIVLNTGDQMFYMARYVDTPVKIVFKEGRIIDIKGGLDAFLLRKQLESYQDENAWMAGHVSMGTDKKILWTAQALEPASPELGFSGGVAESYYGNIQLEIGNNDDVNFCGKNRSSAHLGHCMLDSSLYLDDIHFIDHGVFVPEELR